MSSVPHSSEIILEMKEIDHVPLVGAVNPMKLNDPPQTFLESMTVRWSASQKPLQCKVYMPSKHSHVTC